MYDQFIFSKSLMVRAFADHPKRESEQVEFKFLQTLLNAVIERGEITQDDIQHAIESCGVFEKYEWDMYTADEIVDKLNSIGDKIVGKFSRKQVEQLRRLRNLCYRAAKGHRSVWWEINSIRFKAV